MIKIDEGGTKMDLKFTFHKLKMNFQHPFDMFIQLATNCGKQNTEVYSFDIGKKETIINQDVKSCTVLFPKNQNILEILAIMTTNKGSKKTIGVIRLNILDLISTEQVKFVKLLDKCPDKSATIEFLFSYGNIRKANLYSKEDCMKDEDINFSLLMNFNNLFNYFSELDPNKFAENNDKTSKTDSLKGSIELNNSKALLTDSVFPVYESMVLDSENQNINTANTRMIGNSLSESKDESNASLNKNLQKNQGAESNNESQIPESQIKKTKIKSNEILKTFKNEINALKSQLEIESNKNKQLELEVTRVSNELANSRESNVNLQNENITIKENHNMLIQTVESSSKENGNWEILLREKQEHSNQLNQNLNDVKLNLETCKALLEQKNSEMSNCTAEINVLKSDLEAAKNSLKNKEDQIGLLEATNAALSIEKQNLEEQIKRITELHELEASNFQLEQNTFNQKLLIEKSKNSHFVDLCGFVKSFMSNFKSQHLQDSQIKDEDLFRNWIDELQFDENTDAEVFKTFSSNFKNALTSLELLLIDVKSEKTKSDSALEDIRKNYQMLESEMSLLKENIKSIQDKTMYERQKFEETISTMKQDLENSTSLNESQSVNINDLNATVTHYRNFEALLEEEKSKNISLLKGLEEKNDQIDKFNQLLNQKEIDSKAVIDKLKEDQDNKMLAELNNSKLIIEDLQTQTQKLQTEIEQKQKECETSNSQYLKVKALLEEKEIIVKDLTNDINTFKMKNEELESGKELIMLKLRNHESSLEKKDIENAELMSKLEEYKQNIDTLVTENNTVSAQLQSLRDQQKEKSDANNELNQKISCLNEQIENENVRNKDLTNVNLEYKKTIENLEKELSVLKIQMHQLENNLKQKEKDLQMYEILSKDNNVAQDEWMKTQKAHQQEIESFQNTITELQESELKNKNQLAETKVEHEKQIAQLNAMLADSAEHSKNLELRFAELFSNSEKIVLEKDQLASDIKSLSETIQENNKLIESSNKDKLSLEELSQSQEEKIKLLATALENAELQEKNLNDQLNALRQKADSQESQLNDSSVKLQAVTNEYDEYVKTCNQNIALTKEENQTLVQKCSRLETKYEEVAFESAKIQSLNQDLSDQLKQLLNEAQETQSKYLALTNELQSIKDGTKKTEQENIALKTQIESHLEKIQTLEAEQLNESNIISELKITLNAINLKYEESFKTLTMLENEKSVLTDQLINLTKELETLSISKTQDENAKADSLNLLSSKDVIIMGLRDDNEKLKEVIKNKTQLLESAAQDLADTQKLLQIKLDALKAQEVNISYLEEIIKSQENSINKHFDQISELQTKLVNFKTESEEVG